MNHWLLKSEPDTFSFQNLCSSPRQTTAWEGVRNYQARNYMRDRMAIGDPVLFYHSSCPQPAVVGLALVASPPYPDRTAFDPSSPYFDPKSCPESPRWILVDIRALEALPQPVPLSALRADPELEGMPLLQRGQRLSIQPVLPRHFQHILRLGGATPPPHFRG